MKESSASPFSKIGPIHFHWILLSLSDLTSILQLLMQILAHLESLSWRDLLYVIYGHYVSQLHLNFRIYPSIDYCTCRFG
ncbi:unnamed protein product [Medioppia subpectinata]|uniref:Uncharacterized protein n=1 Tax=Medioppia subpectinata TaxID=1979941 RepID=A0A7R9PTB5_9ACAR|nr:unnamed protein product [Medioppia subpectinata]CAG2099947.1 unnamed protein product [Medioppia subpectinata]